MEMKEFQEFFDDQIKSGSLLWWWSVEGQAEEEEVLKTLQDANNAYELQGEWSFSQPSMCRAYRLLLENMQSKDEKLPEDTLREIHSIIEESGGSGFSISKEEMEKIVREKKEEEKKKRKAKWKPLDDMDWRH